MRHHTIVRSSLAELDSTQEVCNSREFFPVLVAASGFLGCGLSFVLCVQDGYIVVWLVRTVMSGCDVVGQAIASLLVEVGS